MIVLYGTSRPYLILISGSWDVSWSHLSEPGCQYMIRRYRNHYFAAIVYEVNLLVASMYYTENSANRFICANKSVDKGDAQPNFIQTGACCKLSSSVSWQIRNKHVTGICHLFYFVMHNFPTDLTQCRFLGTFLSLLSSTLLAALIICIAFAENAMV